MSWNAAWAIEPGFRQQPCPPRRQHDRLRLCRFLRGRQWLELLKEAAPAVTRVAVMYNPQTSPAGYLPSLRSAAATLRVEVTEAPVRDDGEIERVITAMSVRHGGGVTVLADVFMVAHRAPLIAIAA